MLIEPHAVGDTVFIAADGFDTAIIKQIDGDLYTFISCDTLREYQVPLKEIELLEQDKKRTKILYLGNFQTTESCVRKAQKYQQYGIPVKILDKNDQEYIPTGHVPPYEAPKDIKFYNDEDPDKPQPNYMWHFVYLHGQVEEDNEKLQFDKGWQWQAPDLFVSNVPMPEEPGEYIADFYGKKVIAVVAERYGHLCGRASYDTDLVALTHSRKVEDWR